MKTGRSNHDIYAEGNVTDADGVADTIIVI